MPPLVQKEQGSEFTSKIRDPVYNASSIDQETARLEGATPATPFRDVFKLADSNFNEFTFSELKGDIDPKKLSFLEVDGSELILLRRRTLTGNFAMYNGIVKKRPPKECLITVGATAVFPELIEAALQEDVLEALARLGFTKLTFQVGESMEIFRRAKPKLVDSMGLEIIAFDFNPDGLSKELKACLGRDGRAEGLVITHCGSGTVLDTMRMALPMIVVPNDTLLDNHQEELANELERQGYATKSDTMNLAQAIRLAAERASRSRYAAAQPANHVSGGIASVADTIVGYADGVDDVGVRDEDIAHEENVKTLLD